MRILGFDIARSAPVIRAANTAFDARTHLAAIKAAAPHLPIEHGDASLIEPLPPFSTLYPNRERGPVVDPGIEARSIHSDPRELWYLALPSKLTPNQVTQILRSAQGGDLWQQFQLCQLMLDTWPMLKKCDHEVREAVASVRYIARPYTEGGEEPTASAKAKADLVNRCFRSMTPNRFNDERSFKGLVYSLAGGFLMGLVMEELHWSPVQRFAKLGNEIRLKAATFIHPRHVTYTNDGQIALFDDNYNRLYYAMAQVGQAPDPRKFLCGQFYSTSGSTLGAGFVRPLAWYWTSVVFGREWSARMAQNYGAPFLDVKYAPGMTAQELSELDKNIKEGLANRYIRHVNTSELVISPAQALGKENPQRYLMEWADKQCQLLLLGQTLTSDSPTNGRGTGAQADTHMDVLNNRIQGVAKWVAEEPLTQLARSILLVNYNEEGECPSIEADFSRPMEPMEQAQFLQTIGNSPLPILAKDAYRITGLTMPEEGDTVVIRGNIGVMGDTTQVMDPSPEATRQEMESELMAQAQAQGASEDQREQVQAKLAKLSWDELRALETTVQAAEAAPRLNGQWNALKTRLKL